MGSSISTFDSEEDDYSYVNDDYNKKVSFATQLVTDVWTREYTLPEDKPKLFYSREETQAFRRAYHEEEEREREETEVVSETPSSLIAKSNNDNEDNGNNNCRKSRHGISRVVIVHDNKLETFFDNKSTEDDFDNDSFWSGSLTWY